jgi:hypothetical protein
MREINQSPEHRREQNVLHPQPESGMCDRRLGGHAVINISICAASQAFAIRDRKGFERTKEL